MALLTSGGDAPGMNAAVRAVASRLGTAAAKALAEGNSGIMVAVRGEEVTLVPLAEAVGGGRELDHELYKMAEVLAELPE